MIVRTSEDMLTGIIARFRRQYQDKIGTGWQFYNGKTVEGILHELENLPIKQFAPENIVRILNEGWVMGWCSNCQIYVSKWLELDTGDGPCQLCENCTKKGLALFNGEQS